MYIRIYVVNTRLIQHVPVPLSYKPNWRMWWLHYLKSHTHTRARTHTHWMLSGASYICTASSSTLIQLYECTCTVGNSDDECLYWTTVNRAPPTIVWNAIKNFTSHLLFVKRWHLKCGSPHWESSGAHLTGQEVASETLPSYTLHRRARVLNYCYNMPLLQTHLCINIFI